MDAKYNNQGYLFHKARKTGQDPNFTGKVTIGGVEYRLSGWWKEKNGKQDLISLSVKTEAEYRAELKQHKAAPNNDGENYQGAGDLPDHQDIQGGNPEIRDVPF